MEYSYGYVCREDTFEHILFRARYRTVVVGIVGGVIPGTYYCFLTGIPLLKEYGRKYWVRWAIVVNTIRLL